MRARVIDPDLRRLAMHLGIQTAYVDAGHTRRTVRQDAIEAAAAALSGASFADPAALLSELRASEESRLLPPVHVVWLPGRGCVPVGPLVRGELECQLIGENGDVRGWRGPASVATDPGSGAAGPPLPDLAPGYYDLQVKAGRQKSSCLIIAAPSTAYRKPRRVREWGAFLPLYALHSSTSWGIGDFGDLSDLREWVSGQGGATVATLPLLAAFLEPPISEVSPYSPASRLMWNEIYLNIEALPGLTASEAARQLIASPALKGEVAELRRSVHVDYARTASLKRAVIEKVAASLPSQLRQELARFERDHPEAGKYARFRAVTERHGPWQTWKSQEGLDGDAKSEAFHTYVQWAANSQISGLASESGGLSFDLPLGVHASGYDTWRWPEHFVRDVSAGAPPDAFFDGGQNWGFPPLHPHAIRQAGYDYFISYVRHNLRHASHLRIDHVMGLHRLFLIPNGFEARDGVYVRYPAEELYAILCLESHRSRTEIIGENLGTVPRYVDQAMARHGIAGMYVLPFKVRPARRPPLLSPTGSDVASLNTHDLPPFASWWSGLDIDERERAGLTSSEIAARQRVQRSRETEAIRSYFAQTGRLRRDAGMDDIRAGIERTLAASRARLLMINLEDLWSETEPQNRPGTSGEWPNWRRKARLSLEQMVSDPGVKRELAMIADARGARR